ncbi:RNA ligase family protein [Umezawaea sp.]|uniref:RNA ligase family protein n=1 Tax=Umezawaea sp. TaxID=1955258 RepID=UPI002ED1A5EB
MLLKYPRTRHLEGSRLQPGDEDLDSVAFAAIRGRHVVVEEKLDGANVGVGFDADGVLRLQSRGHYLVGGPRERQFARFKAWAAQVRPALWERLGSRYVMYGEWLFAKHTVFYDALPHFFCEFDVVDRETGRFLSTPARAALLDGAPVVSVPVLHSGALDDLRALTALLGPSTCRTPRWREVLREAAGDAGLDPDQVVAETDSDDFMEGLYIKVEDGDETVDRYKWVRRSFLTAIRDSGSHWASRPILPNRLVGGSRAGL